MRRLIDIARARGFRTMIGIALSANERMKTLAQRLGFEFERDPNDGQLVRMTLALS
jgi:L-amino acid N-acyltransferase YncA